MYYQEQYSMKELLPGIGLGDIRFGMLQNNVYSILGSPNEIEIYCFSELPNDKSEKWYYEKEELVISFNEEDDWKLDLISVNSGDYHIKQLNYFNQTFKDVKSHLTTLGYGNFEIEDWSNVDSPNHKLLRVDEMEMNFWFDNDKLSEIQLGPLFKDEETINWPAFEQIEHPTNLIDLKKYGSQVLFDKLEKYLNNWLDRIFDQNNIEEYFNLLKDFPLGTKREDLILENRNLNYYLNVDGKGKGSIMAKSYLYHKEENNLIGQMFVYWNENLEVLDEFLVLD